MPLVHIFPELLPADLPQGLLFRAAVIQIGLFNAGREQQQPGAQLGGQQRSGQVLVNYGVYPFQLAAAFVHDRYAAAPDDLDEDDDGLEAPPASVPAARVAEPEHRPAPKPAKVRASDRPCLIVDGHRYLLMGAINVLGRDDDADIILDDPGVSRRHSEIRVSIDGPHFVALIRDLGSTNGTFVNGERVDSEHLRDGDQVTIGRTSMTYRAKRP